jgi:hypothetical protein
MPVYPAALNLWLEVVGCPTVCGHCWAVGRSYAAMPLDRIARVLDQAHAFAERRGLGFRAYPMHEVAAHPQAADVLRLFVQHVGAGEFEPFSTTGVPIAMRDDWLELLGTLKELGSTTVWLAFHGLRQTHDEVVARQGAFDETCVSVERAHAAGLRVGANVFVTKTNLRELDELAETTRHIGLDEMSWEPAGFTPTPRGRRFEAHRPTLEDLAPHAEGVVPLTSVYRDRWANLAAYTEAAHRQRALDGLWPAFDPPPKDGVSLVCRPNLDLRVGVPGQYGTRLGNLLTDAPDVVLRRALDERPSPAPSVIELAECLGDANGQRVHFSFASMRELWLDRRQRS